MSRLKDIPEKTYEEEFLGTSELIPLKKYIPKNIDKGEKLKAHKDAPRLSEDEVIHKCTKWIKMQGWAIKTLYTGGIPVAGGRRAPNPCKGIPDSIIFIPKHSQIIWVEWKKSHGGIISQEQAQWHKDLRSCGQMVYVISSYEQFIKEMEAWL